MNIANGRKKVEKPHPAVSVLNFHYCVPPETVAMNYDLGKVIGKEGRTARAMRTLLAATSARMRKRAILDILE